MATRRPNQIRSVASLLVVFLLFASVITSSLSLLIVYKEVKTLLFTKESGSPYRADIQLPLEEREKEEKDSQCNRLLIGFIEESLLTFNAETESYYCAYATPTSTDSPGTRIYLFNRTLLI
jgi:hypothetical protein